MSEGNFLMRLPPGFQPADAAEPWNAVLQKDRATVRLRIDEVGNQPIDPLSRARAGKIELRGDGGARRTAESRTKETVRILLFVRDGKRFYHLEASVPADDDETRKALAAAFENFTLLNPKGAPEQAPDDPDKDKAKTLEHDFYKIKVLKPSGFAERPVEPDSDIGIWTHLRRYDGESGDLAEVRIRSHLTRKFKDDPASLANKRMERFRNRYKDVRIPKKPKSWRVRGAKESTQVQMTGRAPKSGVIVRADYRYVQHENGRTYEFEMIVWANANRAWAKEIRAFWKSIRIRGE